MPKIPAIRTQRQEGNKYKTGQQNMARPCVNSNNNETLKDLLRKLAFCKANTHVESAAVRSEDELRSNPTERPQTRMGSKENVVTCPSCHSSSCLLRLSQRTKPDGHVPQGQEEELGGLQNRRSIDYGRYSSLQERELLSVISCQSYLSF